MAQRRSLGSSHTICAAAAYRANGIRTRGGPVAVTCSSEPNAPVIGYALMGSMAVTSRPGPVSPLAVVVILARMSGPM